MCSIFGALGDVDMTVLTRIQRNARDRGRDGGRVQGYRVGNTIAYLGNWRATPTTEVSNGALQPYDGIVHNGVIANDRELGALPGEIDSQVLPRVLDKRGIEALAVSLAKVSGSYALAVWTGDDILLACNYKPIHYARIGNAVYFASMARHFDGVMPYGTAPVHMTPYTVMSLTSGERTELPRSNGNRALVVASAGLDSTVVATQLVRQGYEVTLLHYRYGCNAGRREEYCIPRIATALACSYVILDLDYTSMQGNSPLFKANSTPATGIAGSELAHEWVAARNLIMLAHTIGYAESHGYHVVAMGNNLEEAGAFPDNEEQLTVMLDALLPYAVRADYALRIVSPVGNLMKHEIVNLGHELGAPFEHTWSCYRGGEIHCGVCGPCYMRRTAFERNGLLDPVFGGEITSVHDFKTVSF